MENEITIYRVRKTQKNIKSQKGAFFMLENAIKKALKTKCNVYDNLGICVWNYKIYKTEVKGK